MNNTLKIFQIVLLITIGSVQSAQSQFTIKRKGVIVINLAESKTKQDSANYAQLKLKVECVGINSRGELQNEVLFVRAGMPIQTNIDFTSLKVNVWAVDTDIKTQSFYIKRDDNQRVVNLTYNQYSLKE